MHCHIRRGKRQKKIPRGKMNMYRKYEKLIVSHLFFLKCDIVHSIRRTSVSKWVVYPSRLLKLTNFTIRPVFHRWIQVQNTWHTFEMTYFEHTIQTYRRYSSGRIISLEIEWPEVSYCLLYLFRINSIFRPTSSEG